MKRLLLSAAALAAFAAQPALAQTSTLNVTGTVPPLCSTGMAATLTMPLGTLVDGNGELAAMFHSSIPGAGLWFFRGTSEENAWCNGVNATYSISLTPLQRTAGEEPAAGFVSHVDVKSELTLGGLDLAAETTGYGSTVGASGQTAGVFSGEMDGQITLIPPAAGVRLVAGEYLGTAVITLTPGS